MPCSSATATVSSSVAVDDLDGALHRALSPKPNSAYVMGVDGTILFRAHWANDTGALAAALEGFVAGEAPRPAQSGGLIKPMLRMLRNLAPVLDRAGRGAWADLWRVAPPLAAIALALKALRLRPGPDATTAREARENRQWFLGRADRIDDADWPPSAADTGLDLVEEAVRCLK